MCYLYGKTVAFICAISFIPCGATLADEKPENVVAKSPLVSLGDGDYFLMASNTNDIVLVHQRKTQTRKWKIEPQANTSVKKEAIWPDETVPIRVNAIALVRRKQGSLLAVIKTLSEDKSFFWAMTIRVLDESAEEVDELRPSVTMLSTGHRSERILAISGDINPPAFTIVTGIISETRPGQIETGSIMFEWCGSLEYALTGRFEPEYPENKTE